MNNKKKTVQKSLLDGSTQNPIGILLSSTIVDGLHVQPRGPCQARNEALSVRSSDPQRFPDGCPTTSTATGTALAAVAGTTPAALVCFRQPQEGLLCM